MNSTKLDLQYQTDKGSAGRAAPVVVVNQIGVAGAVTIARPNNVTAYGANDMIGVADTVTPANAGSAILKFANVGSKGGMLKIIGADLMVSRVDVPAGMAGFTLHLYDAAPAAKLDNDAWDLPSGDRAKYLGSIALGTPVDIGSTIFVETNTLAKQVKLADASQDLYGVLVTAAGFTPAANEEFKVRLQLENRS
jgi:hypothetical protein